MQCASTLARWVAAYKGILASYTLSGWILARRLLLCLGVSGRAGPFPINDNKLLRSLRYRSNRKCTLATAKWLAAEWEWWRFDPTSSGVGVHPPLRGAPIDVRQGDLPRMLKVSGSIPGRGYTDFTMYESLKGYCPWGWGVRPVNWI